MKKLTDLTKDDVLAFCIGEECRKIRIDDDRVTWLSEETNPNLYGEYIKTYEKRLSHGYCPPCGEKAMRDLDGF